MHCQHRLRLSSGAYLECRLSVGHGTPHECPVGNDEGADHAFSAYRASATVVWHETRE